ncbi:MAG: FeoA domain-containing protein [Ruminococcus sp.]|nr:FeoA domain-containing protein [Ruminococcus sp.]
MQIVSKPLHLFSEGEKGIIKEIYLEGSIRDRIQDLGLIRDTEFTCIKKQGNKPIILIVRGAVIALRQCDAMLISAYNK